MPGEVIRRDFLSQSTASSIIRRKQEKAVGCRAVLQEADAGLMRGGLWDFA
jgi:hypothetical protein